MTKGSFDLTDSNIFAMRMAFDYIDKDKDENISLQELTDFLAAMNSGIAADDVENILRQIDADDSNMINFAEFVNVMGRKISGRSKDSYIDDVFSFFDKDKKGAIDAEQIVKMFQTLGQNISEEEVKQMIKEASGGTTLSVTDIRKLLD